MSLAPAPDIDLLMDQLRRPLNLALLAILMLATIAGFILIPPDAQVATRWGFDLQPAQIEDKLHALIQMPIATAAIWVLFSLIARYGNAERHAGQARALGVGLPLLTAAFAVFQVAIVAVSLA